MKITIYTLNVENYAPELTELTYPLLRAWANRINAGFEIISDRKHPEWPALYEKLQVRELSRLNGDDWSIFVDSDALVHPEAFDFTLFARDDGITHYGVDQAPVRFRYDQYFVRDGRNISSCNWFSIVPEACVDDFWLPLEISREEAIANIYPTVSERRSNEPSHFIDDYTTSRNIARFGLKVETLAAVQRRAGVPDAELLWHVYRYSVAEKHALMLDVLENKWQIAERSGEFIEAVGLHPHLRPYLSQIGRQRMEGQ